MIFANNHPAAKGTDAVTSNNGVSNDLRIICKGNPRSLIGSLFHIFDFFVEDNLDRFRHQRCKSIYQRGPCRASMWNAFSRQLLPNKLSTLLAIATVNVKVSIDFVLGIQGDNVIVCFSELGRNERHGLDGVGAHADAYAQLRDVGLLFIDGDFESRILPVERYTSGKSDEASANNGDFGCECFWRAITAVWHLGIKCMWSHACKSSRKAQTVVNDSEKFDE